MTNLEKLKTGTDEEIKTLLISLAYRSTGYIYHELQVQEWLEKEVRTNVFGDVIL